MDWHFSARTSFVPGRQVAAWRNFVVVLLVQDLEWGEAKEVTNQLTEDSPYTEELYDP